jgi:membrane-associated phospholipid phosphatase
VGVGALLRRFRPETVLLAVFLAALAVLRSIHGGSVSLDKLTAKAPLLAAAILALLAVVGERRRATVAQPPDERDRSARAAIARVLGDWLPAILCLLVYENLHDVVRLIHPDTLDGPLEAADAWLFGVQPTIWLQRYTVPWAVDLLALAYASYFVTPTLLGAALYLSDRRAQFRELMLGLVAACYAGFLGYVLVPAVGPIHWLTYTDPPVVHGLVFDAAEDLMNDFRSINRDCFPSLHTAVSSIVLAHALRGRERMRHGRLLCAAYLPLTVALWFSTVYLRYHWVVDVLAGFALAAVVLVAVPRVLAWWEVPRPLAQREGLVGDPALAP